MVGVDIWSRRCRRFSVSEVDSCLAAYLTGVGSQRRWSAVFGVDGGLFVVSTVVGSWCRRLSILRCRELLVHGVEVFSVRVVENCRFAVSRFVGLRRRWLSVSGLDGRPYLMSTVVGSRCQWLLVCGVDVCWSAVSMVVGLCFRWLSVLRCRWMSVFGAEGCLFVALGVVGS